MRKIIPLMILMLLLVVSCDSQDVREALTGRWTRESDGIRYELVLNSDGYGMYIRFRGEKTVEIPFSWETDGFCLFIYDEGFYPEIYDYQIRGNKLEIKGNVFLKETT